MGDILSVCVSEDPEMMSKQLVYEFDYLKSKSADSKDDWKVYYIKIITLKKLPKLDIDGLGGPYVEFKLLSSEDDQLQRSSAKKAYDTDVNWNEYEMYQFITTDKTGSICMSVFADKSYGEAVLIGESLLDYRKETPEMGTVDIIQPLKNPSGEDCGEIEVTVLCVNFSDAIKRQVQAIYEYQLWQVGAGWETTITGAGSIRGRYSTLDHKKFGMEIEDVAVPVEEGWEVTRNWSVQATAIDPNGWEYAGKFTSQEWSPVAEDVSMVVRRRILIRGLRVKKLSSIKLIP